VCVILFNVISIAVNATTQWSFGATDKGIHNCRIMNMRQGFVTRIELHIKKIKVGVGVYRAMTMLINEVDYPFSPQSCSWAASNTSTPLARTQIVIMLANITRN